MSLPSGNLSERAKHYASLPQVIEETKAFLKAYNKEVLAERKYRGTKLPDSNNYKTWRATIQERHLASSKYKDIVRNDPEAIGGVKGLYRIAYQIALNSEVLRKLLKD